MPVPVNGTIIGNIRPGGKFDGTPLTFAIGVNPGGLGGDPFGGVLVNPPTRIATPSWRTTTTY